MNLGKLQIAMETHTLIPLFCVEKLSLTLAFSFPAFSNLEQIIIFHDLKSCSLRILTPIPPSPQLLKITRFGYIFIHFIALQEQRHCTMLMTFLFSLFIFFKNIYQS